MYTKVVAKYLDGQIKKGLSDDFLLFRETFHIIKETDPQEEEEVRLSELKAVFFVDDYQGDSTYMEDRYAIRPTYKKRVAMQFSDGEEIVGYTDDDLEQNEVIRLVPVDPLSNNALVFVIKKNTSSIQPLDA